MEVYQKRLESFAKPKRIKPAKGRAVSISWPHDTADYKATPESLAEAGFFYKPELGFPDNVQCYLCKRELSEWEPDDDPLEIHYQKCEHCPWAVLRCGLLHDTDSHQRFVFPDKSRIPSSPFLEQMRYETFQAGKGWPYDEEGDAHRCHSRRMAAAGFVYSPEHPGDDLAMCLYCHVALSGWEPDDDPMEEHSRRNRKCAFLTHSASRGMQNASTLRASSTKPPSRSQSRTTNSSRARSQVVDEVQETKTYDGSESDAPGTVTASRRGKGKVSKTASSRRAARTELSSQAEETTQEEDITEASSPQTVKKPRARRTRTRSVSRAKSASRLRSKSVSRTRQNGDAEVADIAHLSDTPQLEEPVSKSPPPTVKKSARSKSTRGRKTVTQRDIDVIGDGEIVAEDAAESLTIRTTRSKQKDLGVGPLPIDSAPSKVTRKPSSSKPAVTTRKASSAKPAAARKPSSHAVSHLQKVESTPVTVRDEEDMHEAVDIQPVESTKPTKAKPKAKATSVKVPSAKIIGRAENSVVRSAAHDQPDRVPAVEHLFDDSVEVEQVSSVEHPSGLDQDVVAMDDVEVEGEPDFPLDKTPSPPLETSPIPTESSPPTQPPSSTTFGSRPSDDMDVDEPSSARSSAAPTHSDGSVRTQSSSRSQMSTRSQAPVRTQPSRTQAAYRSGMSSRAQSSASPNPSKAHASSHSKSSRHEARNLAPRSSPTSVATAKPISSNGHSAPSVASRLTAASVAQSARSSVVDISTDEEDEESDARAKDGTHATASAKVGPASSVRSDKTPLAQTQRTEGRSTRSKQTAQYEPPSAADRPPLVLAKHKSQQELPTANADMLMESASAADADVNMRPTMEVMSALPTAPSTPIRTQPSANLNIFAQPEALAPYTPMDAMSMGAPADASPSAKFAPALSTVPFADLTSLTEEELEMTAEEWARRQLDIEYDRFKADAERALEQLRQQAKEGRARIEAL